MIKHREDHDVEPLFQLGFGKRPRQELYSLVRPLANPLIVTVHGLSRA